MASRLSRRSPSDARQPAIVVERYDRVVTPAGVVRVSKKTPARRSAFVPLSSTRPIGGPGARAIVDPLREHSRSAEEDVENYSVLIGEEGRARLAPLYDVASALPYGATGVQKLMLAMKVGGKYRLREIGSQVLRCHSSTYARFTPRRAR